MLEQNINLSVSHCWFRLAYWIANELQSTYPITKLYLGGASTLDCPQGPE